MRHSNKSSRALRATFSNSTVVNEILRENAEIEKKRGQEIQAAADAARKSTEESKKFSAEVDKLTGSLMADTNETKVFTAALEKLERAGVPTEAIIKELGDKTIELRDKLNSTGKAIPDIVERFAQLTEQMKALAFINETVTKELPKVVTSFQKAEEEMNDNFDAFLKERENEWLKSNAENLRVLKERIDSANDEENRDFNDGVKRNKEYQDQIAKQQKEAQDQYVELVKQNSGLISSTLEQDALTVGNTIDALFGNVHQGALTTGNVLKQIGSDFLGHFLGPIKSGFDTFFDGLLGATIDPFAKKAGNMIAGIFGGGTGGGTADNVVDTAIGGFQKKITDALGKIPGLGGIFGGASGAAGGAGTAAGGVSGGGGGLGSAMTGFLQNPWTIGIGAAIGVGVLWAKSQAHHEANTWVQNFQNPFDRMMDDINKSGGSGEDMSALWSAAVADYMTAMQEFAHARER